MQIEEGLAVAASETEVDEVEQSVQNCSAELAAVQESSAGTLQVELAGDLGVERLAAEIAGVGGPRKAAEPAGYYSGAVVRSEQLYWAQAGLWLP